jgi:hypothetical protein
MNLLKHSFLACTALASLSPVALFSQVSEWLPGGAHREGNKIICNSIIFEGDTTPYLSLPEAEVTAQMIFKTEKEKQQWSKLKRDVKKVYPYAVLASIKLKEFDATMQTMKTEVERDRYMKKAEKELKNQFEKDLQNLTLNQGRILIRLIDRETGTTTFGVVKGLRGSFSAFMWNSLAALFGSSLKTKYDPSKGEDLKIEQIIHLIEDGKA